MEVWLPLLPIPQAAIAEAQHWHGNTISSIRTSFFGFGTSTVKKEAVQIRPLQRKDLLKVLALHVGRFLI